MFNFDVLVNGRPVRRYYDDSGKIWIEGRKGKAFTLKVKNNSHERILGIVSVDGLNVINGKHVPVEDSRGYVLNSYSSINIPGWKISKNEVREFYFTINSDNSYAKKIGADERNVGVIATAVYKEKVYPPITYTYTTNTTTTPIDYRGWDFSSGTSLRSEPVSIYSSMNVSDSNENSGYSGAEKQTSSVSLSKAPVKREKVSVGSGERQQFKTHTVDFERGVYEGEVLIYYDTWEGLKKRGVLRDDRDYRDNPQPFGSGKFCPDI